MVKQDFPVDVFRRRYFLKRAWRREKGLSLTRLLLILLHQSSLSPASFSPGSVPLLLGRAPADPPSRSPDTNKAELVCLDYPTFSPYPLRRSQRVCRASGPLAVDREVAAPSHRRAKVPAAACIAHAAAAARCRARWEQSSSEPTVAAHTSPLGRWEFSLRSCQPAKPWSIHPARVQSFALRPRLCFRLATCPTHAHSILDAAPRRHRRVAASPY